MSTSETFKITMTNSSTNKVVSVEIPIEKTENKNSKKKKKKNQATKNY